MKNGFKTNTGLIPETRRVMLSKLGNYLLTEHEGLYKKNMTIKYRILSLGMNCSVLCEFSFMWLGNSMKVLKKFNCNYSYLISINVFFQNALEEEMYLSRALWTSSMMM